MHRRLQLDFFGKNRYPIGYRRGVQPVKKEKPARQKRVVWKELQEQIREHKVTFAVYLILRGIVIAAMLLSLVRRDYENLFYCTLSLILFLAPAFVERNLGIRLPSTMEVIILLFIFAAEILGEMSSFYVKYAFWDTMLHTLNGFLCAAVGFSLVDILNRNKKVRFNLSPLFLAIVAFCFSMTVGVLWEFFECGADLLLHTDMQKDTVVQSIGSIMLDPTRGNHPVVLRNITDVIVVQADGTQTALGLGGYLDIGLLDTMEDLFVNFIGALTFSIIGYFYVRSRGQGKFAKRFIPVANNSTMSDGSQETELTEQDNPTE